VQRKRWPFVGLRAVDFQSLRGRATTRPSRLYEPADGWMAVGPRGGPDARSPRNGATLRATRLTARRCEPGAITEAAHDISGAVGRRAADAERDRRAAAALRATSGATLLGGRRRSGLDSLRENGERGPIGRSDLCGLRRLLQVTDTLPQRSRSLRAPDWVRSMRLTAAGQRADTVARALRRDDTRTD